MINSNSKCTHGLAVTLSGLALSHLWQCVVSEGSRRAGRGGDAHLHCAALQRSAVQVSLEARRHRLSVAHPLSMTGAGYIWNSCMIKRALANRLAQVITLALLMFGVQLGWDSLPAAASGFRAPPPPTCSAVQTIVGNQGISSQPSMDTTGRHIVFWSTGNLTGQNSDGNIEVYLYDGDLSTFSQLTNSTGSILGGFNLWPSINGDGTRVALFSDRNLARQNADGNFEIYVYDSTRRGYQQITQSRLGSNLSPTISADGYHIAFASDQNYAGTNADGNQEIFLANIDAAGTVSFVQLTNTTKGINDQPSISADGSRVAFISNQSLVPGSDNSDGNYEIYLYDTGTHALTQVTQTSGGTNSEPAISADGTRIVFASTLDFAGKNTDGNQEIFLATISATGEISFEQVTETTGIANDQPAIGGHGTRIAYVSGDAVWLYDTVAKAHVHVADGADANSRPSMSGDGTYVAYEASRSIYRANCPWADLTISKSSDADPVVPGTDVYYTIVAENDGPSYATGAVVADNVPSALQNVTWTCSRTLGSRCGAYSGTGGTINQTVNLAVGGRVTYRVRGTLPPDFKGTQLRNEAELTPPSGLTERDLANNTAVITTTVESQADLRVQKLVNDALPNEGEIIAYTITLYNLGPSDASGIVLTDTLPSGLTFVSALAGKGSYDEASGAWTVGNLTKSQTAALTIQATVDVGMGGSDITNSTNGLSAATRELNTANNVGTATLHVNQTPVAADDLVAVDEDSAVTFDVLANDIDPDGAIIPATLSITELPDKGILEPAPLITGTFTYSPTADWNGTDHFTYRICDNGAACDSATVTLTVRPINDAPVLTPITQTLTLTEDDTDNSGWLISDLLGASVSDVDSAIDPGEPKGLALIATDQGTGTWQYQLAGESTWRDVGTVSASSALLIGGDDRLRFRPDGQNATTASISYYAWDQSDHLATGSLSDPVPHGGTAAFSLSSDTATVKVSAVNDAPVLTAGYPTMDTINEDAVGNAGQVVSGLLGSRVSDVDSGAVAGIAIYGLASGNGTWQYQLAGGGSWNAVPAVSDSSALLLRTDDSVRFLPDGKNGTTASFSYYAWDRSDGLAAGSQADASSRGGTSAFSTASDTASITVTDLNDAPVLDTHASPSLTGITEDQVDNQGNTVAEVVGTSISDVDTGALQGIAVYGLVSSTGVWQYQLVGTSSWTDISTASFSNALLLDPNARVRFVPDGKNGTTASLNYVAWDQSDGRAIGSRTVAISRGGTTAFSLAGGTASINVSAVNDAPVLTAAGPVLASISEDETNHSGWLVSAILGASVSDVDSGAVEGMAVYATVNGNGTWQYSLDGGSTWTAVGSVSTSSALLLGQANLVRFVPDGMNGTTASFSYYAWDQATGTAGTTADASSRDGTTAFSTANDTASLTVNAVNDAPVLDSSASPSLSAILEDASNPSGDSVAAILVDGSITDVDLPGPASEALALTGVDGSAGTWQYSLDGGSSWTAVPAVSDSNALLLSASSKLRLVPAANFNGTASLTFRAWDGTAGDGTAGTAGGSLPAGSTLSIISPGGTSAVSSASDSATITVTAVNDAPSFTAGGDVSVAEDAGAQALVWATAISAGPANEAGQTLGFQVENDRPELFSAGPVLDAASGELRFTSGPDLSGTATLTATLQDNGGTLNGGVDRSAAVVFQLTITPVNDPPVITTSATTRSYTENASPLAVDPGLQVTDVDSSQFSGATVQISANYVSSEDSLVFTDTGSISGSWAAASGVLTLSGTDTLANYQAALRGVAYANGSNNPSTALRTISFTATDAGGAASSPATRQLSVTAVNDPPVISLPGAAVNYTEGSAAVVIDGTATASDVDSPDLNTGSLTIDYAANGTADDVLSIRNQGTGAGQIGTSSSNVRYGGTTFGTFTGGSGTTPLVVTFNSSVATPAAIQALLRNITFSNGSGQPSELPRTVRFVLTDGDGGTSNAATQTVTVTGVNTPPSVDLNGNSAGTGYSATFTEDGGAVAIVSSNGLTVNDPDDTTLAYVTVTITNRQYGASESLTATDVASGITASDIAYDAGTGILRIQPATPAALNSFRTVLRSVQYNNSSQAPNTTARLVEFVLNDGEDSGTPVTSTVTIVAVNDAPVLTPAAPVLAQITEDETNHSGWLVSAILGASVSDVDSGAVEGMAAYATVNGNGTWQYSLDGGSTWTAVGSVSTSSALLLRPADLVRFVPDGMNGTTASLSYYAWDQSTGTAGNKVNVGTRGGTTAFSSANDTASLTVNAVNDAPVLDTSASPRLSAILEDAGNPSGDSVAAILVDGSITDVDLPGPASEALALTGVDGSAGTWQYSLDGGSTWTAVPAVSDSNALLLSASSKLRLLPGANFNGTASLTFRAWDGTAGDGTAGTAGGSLPAGSTLSIISPGGTSAVSSASDTATITVNPVNDAPSFTAGGDVSVAEDAGAQALVWATAISAGPANEAGQTLSFQLENDRPELFSAGPVLDAASGELRFTSGPDLSGTATLTATLQDNGGTDNGGVDRSTAVVFHLTITPVNDAPVLDTSASPSLSAIWEDASNPSGDTVAAILVDGSITDVDLPGPASEALVLTGVDGSSGTWQYSLDGGSTWTAVPAVSDSSALALTSTNRLRLLPAANFNGTGSLTFRAWDGSSGSEGSLLNASSNGGTSAFSSASDSATITVNPINDAPSFTAGGDVSVAEDAGAQALVWATAISAGPANEAGQTLGFQVENDRPELFSAGPVLDAASGELRFTSGPDLYGTATLTATLQDNGGTDNGGVDRSAAVVFRLTITPVNDPPVITTTASIRSYTENASPLAVDPGLQVGDVDSSQFSGATVQISANYVPSEDTLVFTDTMSITATWRSVSGALVLSGTDTLANYQAALRSVAYANGSDNPSTALRTITFTATDAEGAASSAATRQLSITPVNDPPMAMADTAATLVNTAVDIDVLTNDRDAEGGTLTVDSVTVPSQGTATTDGSRVTYTPGTDYTGTDSFTYTVSDGQGGSSTAAVTLVVGAGAAPANMTLEGPGTGSTGVSYAFTATVDASTTLPITYTWYTPGQPAVLQEQAGSQMSFHSFQWSTIGDHTVTITATNAYGTISRTQHIQIADPVGALSLPDYRVAATGRYLAFLDRIAKTILRIRET